MPATKGYLSTWFPDQRIIPEKMDIAVGGGEGRVAAACAGATVALAVDAGLTGAFAKRAKQQKWDTSAVTVPDSG